MADLSAAQLVRIAALDSASRAVTVPPDRRGATGWFLSTARMFETYLLTGVSGDDLEHAVQVGSDGLSVLVSGRDVTPERLAAIAEAAS